jgi:4-alpha-glucanotransferase
MIINCDRRGRTAGGRITYRPLIQYEPDDFPPNSKYWHNRAMAAAKELVEKIGYEAYCQWIDAGPDERTWRELYEAIMAYEVVENVPVACLQDNTQPQVQS